MTFDSGTTYMLRRAAEMFDSDCEMARMRVANARTLGEVVRWIEDPQVPVWARSVVKKTTDAAQKLEKAAESRAIELLKVEIGRMQAEPDKAEKISAWLKGSALPLLRGRLPGAAEKIRRELAITEDEPLAAGKAALPRRTGPRY